ncbi:MAG TPA: serine/threonine protein kinase [Planctomycetaceae bacterium]|nr:serine/threonine protein kinase [Planctomycetaceae bacterium]|tara:strand:- start:2416 stop:3885 length:1470 start_codon:yes stop_codon:yes gene_type:complete
MAALSFTELTRQLVRLRLVDADELQQCLDSLAKTLQTNDGLLDALERRNLLTTYQVNKLRKNETSGLVLGNAKLLYRNGSGSFARVFRAVELDSGKMIGVKVLRQRWVEDAEALSQFHREAELLKALKHPNIVPIYEIGAEDDIHYFTMEFIVGGSLSDMIKIRGAVSPVDATRIALDLAEGLKYANSKGISHRDLKKSNVLLTTDGVAKLVDFGLGADEALQPGGKKKRAPRSVDYATLEDNTGASPNDPRSDLYFLGTIYYELLAGQPAYAHGKTREDRQQFSRHRNVKPVNTVKPELPSFVVEAVNRLMHLSPESRHQTPGEAANELRRVIEKLEGGSPGRDKLNQPGAPAEAAEAIEPTLMFVESRPKQQELLREFFTSRGFRVLLLGDLQRSLNRIESSPPDCVILMGASIGREILTGFTESIRRAQGRPVAQIAVLSKDQTAWQRRMELNATETARVLGPPLVIGDLHREIRAALAACGAVGQ